MEKELLEKEIGKDGNLTIEFEGGKLKFIAGVESKGVDAGLYVDVDPDYFIDKLKEAIPGEIDDAVLEMLKIAFK